MKFIQGNFYDQQFDQEFDGVITDPPYKGVTPTNCPITGRLGETAFSANQFLQHCDKITKPVSFLVTFCNMQNGMDFQQASKKTSWKFHTYQIWDKRPTRSWISWGLPLRHCELVFYFKKGDYKFNFRTGKLKPPVKRKTFGGALKPNKNPNSAKVSQEMFSEIVTFQLNHREKCHPTEKPKEFSHMFAKIIGGSDKLVIDPFCGSGNLLHCFADATGIDVMDWKKAQ